MSTTRWTDLSERFEEARDLQGAAREDFLRRLEARDADLVSELRRLLASEALTNDFLEPPGKGQVEERLRLLSFDFSGLKLGEFELVREIGRGSAGVVYLGTQPALGRKVAIKILAPQLVGSPSARERFQREARAVSGLRHPGIVSVLSFGEQQGAVYLVLEYVEGRSLDQQLESLRAARSAGQPVDPSEDISRPEVAAGIALKLAEALEYCHSQGVLHRDIKPQNILLERDLTPRIVDFGLAKDLKLDGMTDPGLVSGTLHYMSPEQAQARSRELRAGTDVYSLGVVLYEMLTLRRPFEGAADSELVEKLLHQRPPAPHHVRPGVPKALSVVCLRALEKSAGDRYRSAAELAKDLRAFLRGSRVAIGARLRFEDAYRYVFLERPWIAVTGLVAIFGLTLALAPTALPQGEALSTHSAAEAFAELPEFYSSRHPEDSPEKARQRSNTLQHLREEMLRALDNITTPRTTLTTTWMSAHGEQSTSTIRDVSEAGEDQIMRHFKARKLMMVEEPPVEPTPQAEGH